MNPLEGRRVLIVEDRYLIASALMRDVEALGGKVEGPLRSSSAALDHLRSHEIDIALLDINLEGETVYPLAEELAKRNIPFIFLTGYEEAVLPSQWRGRPLLSKPVAGKALREAVSRLS